MKLRGVLTLRQQGAAAPAYSVYVTIARLLAKCLFCVAENFFAFLIEFGHGVWPGTSMG